MSLNSETADKTAAESPTRKIGHRMGAFRHDEDGSMVIFSLFLLLMMLMVGGMAVDFMRFESNRARLQSTLDRAVLAASDLEQTLDPESVVRDYFAKAGLLDELTSVTVTEGFNSRSVAATASLDVDMMFLQMLGIDELTVPANGTAIESLNEVEVSLVLDISGSMAWNNRMARLRPAARDFIDTIFDGIAQDELSVSIVPYSTQVNLGPDLAAQYNLTDYHDYSYCVDFTTASYDTTAVSTTAQLQQAGHFDPDTNASSYSRRAASRFVCNPTPAYQVLPFSGNRTALRNYITALNPTEWTSIEMGAKWGVALLDPSAQPVVTGLIGAGLVSADYAGRPLDYVDQDSLKVMVLMTDGENTRHYEIAQQYRTGWSDVWNSNGTYYVDDEEPGDRDGDGRWREASYRPHNDTWTNGLPGTRLTWPQLFNQINVDAHAWYFRGNQTNSNWVYNTWYGNILTQVDQAAKDARTDRICTAAKQQGIVIFTIGFEVNNHSADVLEACASSPSHFYRVEGLEIETAFASIANQINSLRLIQ